MISILLAVSLAVAPCTGDGHNQHRSQTAKSAFRRSNPCPGGADKGSTKRCRGYVIDHDCSLACCGLDEPSNMKWQTLAESKEKDKWENKVCSRTCAGKVLRAPSRRRK